MRQLFHRFYPIEIDPALSVEQKLPHMHEWWNTVRASPAHVYVYVCAPR